MEMVMTVQKRDIIRCTRKKLRSPGRPPAWQRENLVQFWQAIALGRSFEAVEFATLEWVDWFNRRRLLEPIGNIPPAEAEQNYYAAMDNLAMAA